MKTQNKLNAIYGGAEVTSPEAVTEEVIEEEDDMELEGVNGTAGNGTEPVEDVVKPPMPPWYLPNPWAVSRARPLRHTLAANDG